MNSIKRRLVLASLIVLPLICSLFGMTLERAFMSSMKSNEHAQLKLQLYALIASTELIDGEVWLPEQLPENKLNQLSSGLFAAIYSNDTNKLLWQSPSALNNPLLKSWQPKKLDSGKDYFGEIQSKDTSYFFLEYSTIWDTEEQTNKAFQFIIFSQQTIFKTQILDYRKSLWAWLLFIALSITLVQILILKWGLKPIQRVTQDLKAIKKGQNQRLSGNYPSELKDMTNSINSLLETEEAQRKRYKESLSDLAHSLKTPLSVMQGSLFELKNKPENDINNISVQHELTEQINRIDQIISYQLKRSINPPNNPFANTVKLKPICEKVISTLDKVYIDHPVSTHIQVEPSVTFKGDADDMFEILGNILDNAYKYGNGELQINAQQTENHLKLIIEDNGPGISENKYSRILERGQRADTSTHGQGIGLAIISDIISHYGGSLSFGKSSLGGLAVIIEL